MIRLQEFFNYIRNGVDLRSLLIMAGMALFTGAFICFADRVTRRRTIRDRRLAAEIILLPVVCAFGVAGIRSAAGAAVLASVLLLYFYMRFRAPKCSPGENLNLLWAAASGVLIGEEKYVAAAVLCIVVFLVFLAFGLIREESVRLLTIRGYDARALEAEGIVFRTFRDKAVLKEKTMDSGCFTIVYEIPQKLIRQAEIERNDFLQRIRGIDGVSFVQLTRKADEKQ